MSGTEDPVSLVNEWVGWVGAGVGCCGFGMCFVFVSFLGRENRLCFGERNIALNVRTQVRQWNVATSAVESWGSCCWTKRRSL